MASKIDENKCLKCGLCIDNCPHQAIKGKGEHRVSTSKVFELVWIDPELCQDCGTCTSTEYWCPGQAISADVETKAEDKKSIEEAIEGDRYSKYIYYYDGDWKLPEDSGDIPFQMITRFDNSILPGSHFYWFQWIMPHDKPFMEVGHPPHIHKDHELVFQIGTDPDNPEDLGAEVEIFLGPEMERHVITKTCVLFFPANFVHCPWRPLRTWRPWIFLEVNQGPVHTEKGYHHLLKPEQIGSQLTMGHFEDEGY